MKPATYIKPKNEYPRRGTEAQALATRAAQRAACMRRLNARLAQLEKREDYDGAWHFYAECRAELYRPGLAA